MICSRSFTAEKMLVYIYFTIKKIKSRMCFGFLESFSSKCSTVQTVKDILLLCIHIRTLTEEN